MRYLTLEFGTASGSGKWWMLKIVYELYHLIFSLANKGVFQTSFVGFKKWFFLNYFFWIIYEWKLASKLLCQQQVCFIYALCIKWFIIFKYIKKYIYISECSESRQVCFNLPGLHSSFNSCDWLLANILSRPGYIDWMWLFSAY